MALLLFVCLQVREVFHVITHHSDFVLKMRWHFKTESDWGCFTGCAITSTAILGHHSIIFLEGGTCVRRRGACGMAQWHNGQSKSV